MIRNNCKMRCVRREELHDKEQLQDEVCAAGGTP